MPRSIREIDFSRSILFQFGLTGEIQILITSQKLVAVKILVYVSKKSVRFFGM